MVFEFESTVTDKLLTSFAETPEGYSSKRFVAEPSTTLIKRKRLSCPRFINAQQLLASEALKTIPAYEPLDNVLSKSTLKVPSFADSHSIRPSPVGAVPVKRSIPPSIIQLPIVTAWPPE